MYDLARWSWLLFLIPLGALVMGGVMDQYVPFDLRHILANLFPWLMGAMSSCGIICGVIALMRKPKTHSTFMHANVGIALNVMGLLVLLVILVSFSSSG